MYRLRKRQKKKPTPERGTGAGTPGRAACDTADRRTGSRREALGARAPHSGTHGAALGARSTRRARGDRLGAADRRCVASVARLLSAVANRLRTPRPMAENRHLGHNLGGARQAPAYR
jgi:hypothetical protein